MRTRTSLSGDWDVRPVTDQNEDFSSDASAWPHSACVPGAWELTLGPTFDGACWYRTRFASPTVPKGHRVWLRFEAVATHAKIWLNSQEVGGHSGDWTPFEFDVTDQLCVTDNLLILRVQEDAGHVTRGFTCTAMPHAGGIWQDVCLDIRPEKRMFEPVCISSDFAEKRVTVAVESNAPEGSTVQVSILPLNNEDPIETAASTVSGGKCSIVLSADKLEPWGIGRPNLYLARVRLLDDGQLLDEVTERFGFREVTTEGRRILLNGEPIYPRGWLTWGVYPEHIAPAPTPEEVRGEFINLFDQGFNMAKNCLWLPPRHYYDVADEMGALIWLEYPTWATVRQWSPAMYPEMDELFIRDRNHPCIIIRSLTCEAPMFGPEPFDSALYKHLYNSAHALIPGGLIMDNSGFFAHWVERQKEMYTDAYSDHPYMDCQNFNAHLDNLTGILSGIPPKPLITGESMDCDTWRSSADFRAKYGDTLPWWLEWEDDKKPAHLCGTDVPTQEARERQSEAEIGREFVRDMTALSYRHQLAHLKYQVEEYRKRTEFTGYTLIGVRDSTGNTPGFHDDLGRLKHTPAEMLPWNSDTVLLLDTHSIHRNFRAGSRANLDLLVSCFDGSLPNDGNLTWSIANTEDVISSGKVAVFFEKGKPVPVAEVEFDAPIGDSAGVYLLRASMLAGNVEIANEWKLWVFPEAVMPTRSVVVDSNASLSHLANLDGIQAVVAPDNWVPSDESIAITNCITPNIAKWLEQGGRAVVIVPPVGVLPVEGSCMWREATEVFANSVALGDFPHEDFVDVQFIPISSNHKLVWEKLKGKADTLLRRTNPRSFLYGEDLVQMTVGTGALLACTLNLTGEGNFTGAYLLSQLAQYAASPACKPSQGMSADELVALCSE